jgi:ABC-2 type transport system ATP-binding protein
MQGASTEGPLAIEVRNLHKRFRLPGHRPETFKERAVHPFRRDQRRELKVLDGVSFDVRRGGFLGIVGRNGSGKSTLLKLLASIYRADEGSIRVAGRVAPVIELGVGFQPELAARENIILNGLMMGLTEGEAESRIDAVLDYSELRDFVDLKLKNYSSGMRVRLAFAVMLHVDADVLLLDEVLAVGDISFQRKCEETFRELRVGSDKTVLLVTNQPATIAKHCETAILLERGRVERAGHPDEVAAEYEQLMASSGEVDPEADLAGADRARVTSLQLIRNGAEAGFDQGREIRIRADVEAGAEIARPGFSVQIRDEANTTVFFPPSVELSNAGAVSAGDQFTVETVIENKLAPGRYHVYCAVTDHAGGHEMASMPARETFIVRQGGMPTLGLVTLDHEITATRGDT